MNTRIFIIKSNVRFILLNFNAAKKKNKVEMADIIQVLIRINLTARILTQLEESESRIEHDIEAHCTIHICHIPIFI